jgi:hypothetical protein
MQEVVVLADAVVLRPVVLDSDQIEIITAVYQDQQVDLLAHGRHWKETLKVFPGMMKCWCFGVEMTAW